MYIFKNVPDVKKCVNSVVAVSMTHCVAPAPSFCPLVSIFSTFLNIYIYNIHVFIQLTRLVVLYM